MKILLINLPIEGEVQENTTPDYLLYDFMNFPPLGLMAIATGINPKHELKLLDVSSKRWNINDTLECLKKFEPEVLGISVVTRRLYALHKIAKKAKKLFPNLRIIAGGPHINYFPMDSIQIDDIDYVLPGFGEIKFPQLIDVIERGEDEESLLEISNLYYKTNGHVKKNLNDTKLINLDDFPFPDRGLIDLDLYYTVADKAKMTTVYTSRGCPYRCIFCDVQEKRFYYRSPKNIVDEFEYVKSHGIDEIHIFDDTFNLNRRRVLDMCNEILKRGLDVKWNARVRVFPFDREMAALMKKAGCVRLHVGVESLDPGILKYMKKKVSLSQIKEFFAICDEVKMNTLSYFIVGFPGETDEYRKTLFKEIKKLKTTYVYINILYPLAKTEFYDELVKNGTLKKDYWAEFIKTPVPDFSLPSWRSSELQKKLIDLADDIHRKFYLSPSFIINDLRKEISFNIFLLKARVAILLLIKTMYRKKKKKR
jgi:radical SAM superfamily enzyme YgiQ (UPF0313 family)